MYRDDILGILGICIGDIYWGGTPIMENQMEKKLENEMETGRALLGGLLRADSLGVGMGNPRSKRRVPFLFPTLCTAGVMISTKQILH